MNSSDAKASSDIRNYTHLIYKDKYKLKRSNGQIERKTEGKTGTFFSQ